MIQDDFPSIQSSIRVDSHNPNTSDLTPTDFHVSDSSSPKSTDSESTLAKPSVSTSFIVDAAVHLKNIYFFSTSTEDIR